MPSEWWIQIYKYTYKTCAYSLECCMCGTYCTMNNVHGTTQVKEEQFSTLVCRSTVAPAWRRISTILSWPFWLAIYRRGQYPSCRHMVVCVVLCACMCVTCAWCMVVYMSISVCHCISTFRMVDTSLQVYLHVYLITQVQNNTHSVLTIARYFSCYMLQLTQCDVLIMYSLYRTQE